jgi:uncharacterized protein (UPF0264 family)
VITAAVAGAALGGAEVVAVAYADFACAGALSPDRILDAASGAGARGVLLDTVRKDGPSTLALVSADRLAAWVNRARSAGLFTAVAGRLRAEDVPIVHASGADIAGVRGAACDGGRDGDVNAEKVRRLRAALRARTHHTGSSGYLREASGGNPDRG